MSCRMKFFVAVLGVLLHVSRAHIGAPDDDVNVTRLGVNRIAMMPAADKAKFVRLYFIDRNNDKGTLITSHNEIDLGQRLALLSKMYVTFNGHPTSDSLEAFTYLREKLFDDGTPGIIAVFLDWSRHKIPFEDGLALAGALGMMISKKLLALNIPIENYHFVGHCIGADVATMVAKYLGKHQKAVVSRLTVFDPFVEQSTHLQKAVEYVKFVDVYHGGIYTPAFPPIGTVDFYPNGGIEQSGCESDDPLKSFQCSHQRTILLYAESIKSNINAIEAHYNQTEENLQVISSPRIATFGHKADQSSRGAYYLPTHPSSPYLMKYF